MTQQERAELTEDLMELLGEDGFFTLVEAHGGIRVYVPAVLENSELPGSIGVELTQRLSKRYACAYIRVPLAREFRARRYIEADMSIKDIARRLGLTETGVNKLLKRTRKIKAVRRPRRKDTRQMNLFTEYHEEDDATR